MRQAAALAIILVTALAAGGEHPTPRVVGTPPADGGRGLVRVNTTEIRHYDGDRKQPGYLVSRDNGETWAYEKAGKDYPPNYGGIAKEAPAFARNPRTGEFVRVQPIKDHVFLSKGGLDGQWVAATKEGKASANWRAERGDLFTLPGIVRSPLFIDGGRRLIVPTHSAGAGTTLWLSDDGGLSWRKSRSLISAPPHEAKAPHRGLRWQNLGVEATVVELRDGRLWALLRTSQDYHYESFSRDRGETWTPGAPSRFAGTLTMPTLGRLADGRLLALWTNQAPLPEVAGATGRGEDAFTNRDTLHAAVSDDEGRTWRGFREVGLDEHRGRADYATWGGPQDRGNHQAEFVQLDADRILVSYGQHANHRRLAIVDLRWLLERRREADFAKGAGDWLHHTFVPVPKGHCSYNRKPAATIIEHPSRPGTRLLDIAFLDDPELINAVSGADYRSGGAAWNFPAGTAGKLRLRFRLPAGSSGAHVSLMDRLHAACDRTAPQAAQFSQRLVPGGRNGSLRVDTDHELTLEWTGVARGATCRVSLDGKPATPINLLNPSANGISYLHVISAGEQPGPAIQLLGVAAEVR
jgi:hypothetical protein